MLSIAWLLCTLFSEDVSRGELFPVSIFSVYFEVGHAILYTIFIVVVVGHFLLQLATFNSVVVVDHSVVVDFLSLSWWTYFTVVVDC